MNRLILCCLAMMALCALPGVAQPAPWPAAPAAQWTVQCADGDTASLFERDDCLGIRFYVQVKGVHQVEHVIHKQASFRVLLKQARPLSDAQTRLSFEALGMDLKPRATSSVALVPLIRDANGEIFHYTPFPGLHLQAGSSNWSTWMTRYWYASEAGGAMPQIVEVEGGDGNAWPDGALTFIGFEVQIRQHQFGARQGELFLGSITPGPMQVAYTDPYRYADSLVNARGEYRVAVRVTNAFQGQPIREYVAKLAYDPEQLQSRRQRISFPLGPDGNYWITYQVTDAAGKVVAGDALRAQAVGSPVTTLPAAIDLRREPALGYLRINPTAHTRGVYGAKEPLQVLARLFRKGAEKLTISWRLRLYAYDTTVREGAATVAYQREAYRDVPLTLPWLPGHDAYRLTLQVKRDGIVVDAQEYLLGRQTDFSRPYATRAGKVLDRDYVKQSAYFRVTYHNGNKKFATEAEQLAHFRAFCEQSAPLTRYATYMIDLAEFETLPGVYDFAVLDRIMDEAADRGCAITVRLAHADAAGPFVWLPYSRQYSFDGTPIAGHPVYGGYALTYQPYLDGWFRAYRALYDRYRTHPGFQGYYIMKPGGEWTVLDRPFDGCIAGYEPSTAPVFRAYLQKTLQLTLAQLNARWGTQYRAWDEVFPPLPDLKIGKTPDLRMEWLDFTRFKAYLEQWWFDEAATRIRAYDPNHVVIVYHYQADKELIGKADYLHNGGNQLLNREGWFVDAWKGGLGWITEPHSPHRWADYFDPAEKGWILDWSTFILMAQAGGGGANLHVYYYPNPTVSLPAHYGGSYAYDRMEHFKPIYNELHSVKIIDTPPQVAVVRDPYTLFSKHRTVFTDRRDDLQRWLELAKLDAVSFEDMREEHLNQYKLILPNILDEVMSKQSLDLIDRAVRGGACLMMTANTGKYCPEIGSEPFQLLRRLAITPPSGRYVQETTGVSAQVVAANPLFTTGATLKFFTLADYRRELLTPRERTAFNQWPYRWLPQTDYFGYYGENTATNGEVLARFPSGAVALSRHWVEKGEALVFWGTPDYKPELLKGLMARAAVWAGVHDPRQGNPIPYTLEGHSASLNRHYALFYQDTPGKYTVRLPQVPDGLWFLDDMVSTQRLGLYTGKELRENGLPLTYIDGYSPLKIIRMMPKSQIYSDWVTKYRTPAE